MPRSRDSVVMPRVENGAKKAEGCAEICKSAGKEEDGVEVCEEALSDRIVVPPSDPGVEEEDEEDDIVVLGSKPESNELVCLSSENESFSVGVDDGHVESSAKPSGVPDVATGCKRRSYSSSHARSFDCTACGKEMFSVREIHVHPKLVGVGICSDCYDFLFSSPFTKDLVDFAEDQCLWCGQGGELVMCDKCDKVFCKSCIVRNFGRKKLTQILDETNWSCFRCNPELLRDRVEELREFRNSVPAETNVSVRRQGAAAVAGKPRTKDASGGVVRRFGDGPSIAELLAFSEEKKRKQEGVCTSPRNTCRLKSRTQKARPSRKEAGTSLNRADIRHPTEAKRHEGILKQAPSATAARTWIRPHQWIEKRREAAERRKRSREVASPIAKTSLEKSVDFSEAQAVHRPSKVSNLFAKFSGAKSIMTT